MVQFMYFEKNCDVSYPVGEYFSSDNFDYVREVARIINKTLPTGKLILVVRGHSGSILAGSIAYLLRRRGRNVLISISRKSESTHGSNLEGVSLNAIKDAHIVVIDDFTQTGETIKAILTDLYKRLEIRRFDMLCIANHWDEADLTKEGGKRGTNKYWDSNQYIAKHFRYICCNKPLE